jgi:yeast amino acid transporter
LFVGSGSILALVGPAPLFMAYLSMMIVVWNVMNNLAEIVTYLPMKGITIPYFVKRFVDPSLGMFGSSASFESKLCSEDNFANIVE